MLVPLVVHTSYSMMRGPVQPRDFAAKAKAAGLPALGICDRNAVYGLPAFVEACGREGIIPVLGAELRYGDGRAILIPKGKEGFARISRLLCDRAAGACRDSVLGLERSGGDIFVLSDDPVLLGSLPPREDIYALLTQANKGRWRRLGASGHRPVFSPEISFLESSQREIQRLLLAIAGNVNVSDVRDGDMDSPETLWTDASCDEDAYYRAADNLGMSACHGEACEANALIAKNAMHGIFSGFIFPRYKARDGGSAAGGAEALRRLVLEGAERRYSPVTSAVRGRIEYELALIDQKGFNDYFLVVRDISRRASRICGRGSAAASIVSYCLGITEVDPIRHSLYFDRFLNPGRSDPPDIDIDFAWDERDALLDDVIRFYGPEHAARVSNHNCFRFRSALRETARAYGMPEGEISSFERSLRVDAAAAMASADPEWKKVTDAALRIEGLPRNLGTHSGGVIIVPDELADRVPIEKTGNGIRVIAWDKDGAEDAGLVKIDLLGNRSLAVVRDAIANIRENGVAFREESWHPIDDADTVALLSRGDTMGVFYVESPAMRQLQAKTGMGDFDHLVIHSSIIRPAANKYINEYVDRLKGKPWEPLHPALADLFSESYGIMCYQEDVSKAAIALAGFSSSEADGIRKILSKKDASARLREYRERFVEGARAKGIPDGVIDAVWDMMQSFSGYSFVKAHSASYAMLSFQSAFLRAHYPAEFMAAVMSNHGGFYSILAYASEARRMGLVLLPPDVNLSEFRCKGRGREIRFGLGMISSLGEPEALAIIGERSRAGAFSSPEDFARRAGPGREEAEALVGAGALDGLSGGEARSGQLMTLLSMCARREGASPPSSELFAEEPGAPRGARTRAAPGPQAARKRREAELKYLGTTLDIHPLALWPKAFGAARVRADSLSRHVGANVRLLGWAITAKPVLTSSDEPMEFVSFEDETALFESVLFPEAFRRFRHLLFEQRPLWVSGKVEEDRGAVTLTVESISPA